MICLFVIKMFSVLISRRNIFVTALFVIAITGVTINAAVSMIDSCLRLGDRPPETRAYFGGSGDASKGRYDVLDNIDFISFIFSFATVWIATAQLLKYYARRIDRIKYYSIIICPLIFFIAQFGVPLLKAISPVFDPDPFTVLSYALVLSTLSKRIGGLMLGICFWSMASMLIQKSAVRNYLIIAGFGFLLPFYIESGHFDVYCSISSFWCQHDYSYGYICLHDSIRYIFSNNINIQRFRATKIHTKICEVAVSSTGIDSLCSSISICSSAPSKI